MGFSAYGGGGVWLERFFEEVIYIKFSMDRDKVSSLDGFIFVVDVFSRMVEKSVGAGVVEGLKVGRVEIYVIDIILFFDVDFEKFK